jgi:lysyl-tRNA synthetase class 2
MNSSAGLQCLRPYLFKDLPVARRLVYSRFYNTTRRLANQAVPGEHKARDVRNRLPKQKPGTLTLGGESVGSNVEKDSAPRGPNPVELRIKELTEAQALVYPRMQRTSSALSCAEFSKRFSSILPRDKSFEPVTIRGILRGHPVHV